LGLSYSLIDKEVYKAPPSPAFVADGEYIESSSTKDAVHYAEVRVSLRGQNDRIGDVGNTSQARLIEAAVAVASLKLAVNGAPLTGPEDRRAIPLGAAVAVKLYDNSVTAQMRAQFPTNRKRLKGITGLRKAMAYTPLSDDRSFTAPPYLD